MSGLVPERRTNKNGVTQTKWIRPVSTSAAGSPLPAPVVRRDGLRLKRLSALERHCVVAMPVYSTSEAARDEYRRAAERAFAKFPEEMLEEIHGGDFVGNEVLQAGVRKLIERGARPGAIRDFVQLSDYLVEVGYNEEDVDALTAMAEVPGLHPNAIAGEYPARRRAQLKGLIDATLWAETIVETAPELSHALAPVGEGRADFMTDPDLIALAVQYPEQIGDVMKQRRSLDPAVLRPILEHDVAPLRDGVL